MSRLILVKIQSIYIGNPDHPTSFFVLTYKIAIKRLRQVINVIDKNGRKTALSQDETKINDKVELTTGYPLFVPNS
jgi:hypothetical protein